MQPKLLLLGLATAAAALPRALPRELHATTAPANAVSPDGTRVTRSDSQGNHEPLDVSPDGTRVTRRGSQGNHEPLSDKVSPDGTRVTRRGNREPVSDDASPDGTRVTRRGN